jgi:hypothetical protein
VWIAGLVLASGLACAVALLAAECAVRLHYFGRGAVLYFWRYDRASLISPEFVEPDESIGHRFRPGVDAWDKGHRVRTNSLGFRDREHDFEPAAGVLRIVVLGDSVAAGETVAARDAFPARLERWLRGRGVPVEVVNLAIPMTGTYQHARILGYWGQRFRPQLIVYLAHLNDLCDNPEFLDGRQAQWLERMLSPQGWPLRERWLRYSFFYDWLKTRKLHRRLLEQTENPAKLREARCQRQYPLAWEYMEEALAEVRVAARGVPLVYAILPFLGYLDGVYPFHEIHRRLGVLASANGFHVVDLLPVLRGRNGKELWVYPSNSHPGAAGHALIADAVGRALVADEGLLGEVPGLREAAEAPVSSRLKSRRPRW